MVVMMDGTGTELGPQVLSALFGYMIGVACAVASFQCGRNVAEWVESRHPCRLSPINSVEEGPAANDDLNNYCGDKRQRVKTWRMHPGYLCCNVSYGSLFLVIILFVAFLVGDFVAANAFYRKMWMTVALTPFGAIIRWRLGNMNGKGLSAFHLEWFPVGTFMCNVEAAAISIIAVALLGGKLANQNNAAIIQPWIDPLLDSIGAGFAGSLSTVSTLVKEMAVLSSPAQRHGYCLATILCSMLISILFYRPVWHAVS